MQIDDAINALHPRLQFHEALDGSEVIAEMQRARRLDAGKDTLFEGWHRCAPIHEAAGLWHRRERGKAGLRGCVNGK
jgi:hypothetical protein